MDTSRQLLHTSTAENAETTGRVRWPTLAGGPVLDSMRPVIEKSRDVHAHINKIVDVAGCMAYEDLPMPDYVLPLRLGEGNADETIDFILTATCIDTAFTDFSTHIKFQVDYAGRTWSDSDALFACMKRTLDSGTRILEGDFLARVTRSDMERIFAGNIELPMLDEKTQIWKQVGAVLAERFAGRFHNFVRSCSPKLYDDGNGLVDRLITEFPRFNDVSQYDGHSVKFYKLAQLGIWFLYSSLGKADKFRVNDLNRMTAFADYIVPVALRLLGITSYSPELESAINSHKMIPGDSRWEVEIRAHCIYATALLAEEINKLRPSDRQVIVPQVDARLWTHYHTTWFPHHLTKTVMY
jgi:Queuosine salvage protein